MSISGRKKSNFYIIPKPSHKVNISFFNFTIFTIVFIYLKENEIPLSEIQKCEKKPETYRAYITNSHTVP